MLPEPPRPTAGAAHDERDVPEARGYHVCFVCTGNICRSPIAESVFRARVTENGLEDQITVSSAGTGGWHEGDLADPRAIATLEHAGYESAHTARQFRPEWFATLDLVIALDRGHERELRRLAPTAADAAKVRLLRTYASPGTSDPAGTGHAELAGEEVADPYYGSLADFETVLEQVEAAAPGLLTAVREELAALAGNGVTRGQIGREGVSL